jgi:hypothetical protein
MSRSHVTAGLDDAHPPSRTATIAASHDLATLRMESVEEAGGVRRRRIGLLDLDGLFGYVLM